MRHNQTARRGMRHRNNNNNSPQNNGGYNQRRGFQNKNRVMDSNGPDVRIRGTAYQIVEKYMTLAKDAHASGDRVMSESYLQHAEHYQRMINSWEEEYNDQHYSDRDTNPYERFSVPPPAGSDGQHGGNYSDDQQQQPEEDLGLPASIVGSARKTETASADA
jgi:hypothetical protein